MLLKLFVDHNKIKDIGTLLTDMRPTKRRLFKNKHFHSSTDMLHGLPLNLCHE